MSTRKIRDAIERLRGWGDVTMAEEAEAELEAIERAAKAIIRAEYAHTLTEDVVRGNREGIALMERIAKVAP